MEAKRVLCSPQAKTFFVFAIAISKNYYLIEENFVGENFRHLVSICSQKSVIRKCFGTFLGKQEFSKKIGFVQVNLRKILQ